MKLKGSALIRSMPHIQCPQQTEWLSDRMTKWRCDSRTRNKRSVLILLTVPSRGWHWAMCTSVGPTHPLAPSLVASPFSPLQYAMWVWLLLERTRTSSLHSILPHLARAPSSWSSCAWGGPFVSFSSGGSDWTAKWHSDSQLSAKSHSARFLVNDDDSARCCCCCRCCCWSLPHGQLDIFNAPLWPYQRRHMSLRVLAPLLSVSLVWAETAAEGDTCLSECQSRWCTAGVRNI